MLHTLAVLAVGAACFFTLVAIGRRAEQRGPHAKAPIKEQVSVTLTRAPQED